MQKLMAYLQLLRLPTVFTAMADICLGFLLNHLSLEPTSDFLFLLLASSCLYLSGMVFNDVFDLKQDTEERPNRPIPSGRISKFSAIRLGIILMMAGVGAAQVVGKHSLIVAGLLVAFILAYNAFLKRTPLGPLAMGGCRFLNVILGASAATMVGAVWGPPQLPAAIGLGIYVIGLTWFARTEAKLSSRTQLAAAMGTVNLGIAILVGLVLNWPGEGEVSRILFFLAIVALIVNRRLVAAILNPIPEKVQPAIKTMLFSLVWMDAALVLFKTGDIQFTIMTAALLIPTLLLSRLIPMT